MRNRSFGRLARGATALTAAVAIALLVATTPSSAQTTPTLEGTVLLLDGGDVVVDLGKARGVGDGDVVELWRPIKVKHPVTGRLITDRFKIGELRVTQARDVLSLARPNGALLRPVEPGDVVTIAGTAPAVVATVATIPTPVPKPTATAKPTTTSTATAPASTGTGVVAWGKEPCKEPKAEDEDAVELSVLFDNLSGASPDTRVLRYEAWAKAHPKSRFARVVLEEASALRETGEPRVEKKADTIEVLSASAPSELLKGRPASIGFELVGPVSGAVFYAALDDEAAFQPVTMTPAGPRYWVATLPESRVNGARLRWFVQGVLPTGKTVSVVADPVAPRETKIVEATSPSTPKPHESTAALWMDYADYNRFHSNTNGGDHALQVEGYFGMRIEDVGLRAVRSGLGVYRGYGGSVDDLDTLHVASRQVGLTYGFLEAEWGLTHFWGLVTRAVVGLGENGLDGGGQVFVRLGNDKATNLMIGGEFLGGIGLRGITQIELNMFPRFPIMVRTEVTNQPAGVSQSSSELAGQKDPVTGKLPSGAAADVGVRAIVQFGFRQTKNFAWYLRGSYQGRNIIHSGPGAGMGVTFSW
jgi:hypothetical protein